MQKLPGEHQTTKQWCRIYHLGLEPRETLVIESLFRSNPELAARYVFGPPTDFDAVDLLFVNGDDEEALACWQQLRLQRPEMVAIVAASAEGDFGDVQVLRKPLNFRNFVTILDAITSIDIHQLQAEANAGDLRVLVVDDSLPARQYMKLKLEQIGDEAAIGLHIDMVESGEKALEIALLQRYDLAFLDVVMPGIDGYEVCRRLKAAGSIRVAMLTGRSSSVDFTRGREAGCDNYLPKPANDADLRTILRLTALKKQVGAPRLATAAG